MSGDRYELGRRRFLQATGAGIAGVAALSTGVGASQARQVEEAPDEDAYEEILSEMDGDGTEEEPYVVTDVVELQAISGDVTARYELGNDIDASPTANWNDGEGFDPIFHVGSDGEDAEAPDEEEVEEAEEDTPAAFTGWLEGNGHEISGLTIDRPDDSGAGLILINEGGVLDLTITDATVVGGISGIVSASNAGGIGEVTVDGTVTGDDGVGGVTGVNEGVLMDIEADVDVAGERLTGGLTGRSAGTISDSAVTGTVDGTVNTGGVVGQNSGTAQRSDADVDVTGTVRVGGFAGELSGTIAACTASGQVTGREAVGGFLGENWGELFGSTASGSVEGEEHVGGVVGKSFDEIYICSSTGDVTGEKRVGGVLGWGRSGTLVRDVFTVGSVTGDTAVGALAGLLGWEFFSGSERAELRRAYWSTDGTDRDPVGQIDPGRGEVEVDEDTIAGLEGSQFVGEDVDSYMTEFDFEEDWRPLPDDVPIPRIQTTPVFEILGVSTTEITVRQDEPFDIEFEVENVGEWEGVQTIGLLIDGEVVNTMDQHLEAGESAQLAFEGISASDIPVGSYPFVVEVGESSAGGIIEVESAADDGDDTEPADGDDDPDTAGPGEADDDGPGFGIGAALTGVGTGAYLLSRRLREPESET